MRLCGLEQVVAGVQIEIMTKQAPSSTTTKCLFYNGATEAIRTPDLRIRNPLLYPAELRGLICLQ